MKGALVAATGIIAAGCWAADLTTAPKAAADNPVCTASTCAFLSPSRNISCEIDYQREPAMADEAYCQTNDPPQSVRLSAAGVVTSCTGVSCLGNAGEGTPTLAYDQTAGLGPFNCASKPDGITCTVASGHGFTIAASGIKTLG